MRSLILAALLIAGCSAKPTLKAHTPAECRESVPTPEPLVGKPTPAKISALEIRVAEWGEAERERGDCWRDVVEKR